MQKQTIVDRAVPQPSDNDLITATRAGDTAAYGVLYRRHVDAARTEAGYLVRDAADAEDLVAEAFTRILALLLRGGGPGPAFRAYLYTALRRIRYDQLRREQRHAVSGELERLNLAVPFVDPALEALERSLIAHAYRSLPDRWQVVLWYTEIARAKPADLAPLLGISANGVAALAYRARQGLRRAYLQTHLGETPPRLRAETPRWLSGHGIRRCDPGLGYGRSTSPSDTSPACTPTTTHAGPAPARRGRASCPPGDRLGAGQALGRTGG